MIGEIEETINRKVRESIDENQREYYLREKLRAIKEELGDSVPKEDDAEMIREELEKNPYPQHVKDKIEEELRRFETMPAASSEANVVRTYIDWMMKTPWYQETKDVEDIQAIENFSADDIVVAQGDTKKSVVLTDKITVINAMSQLYMSCVIS